jgi:cellulose biosynthesis protein BcsQ
MSSVVSERRFEAPRISVFNHKGGVGKTTLTVNIAYAMIDLGKKVLLVDSDPQANLTSYLIEDSVVDALLDESDGPTGGTVWSALRPVVDGVGEFRVIPPVEVYSGLYLMPGDIRLAEFEEQLSTFWSECLQRRIRGFRGTCALSSLVNRVAMEIDADVILYDTGPNIGALNRVILLDSDFFAIPAAADLFSVRATKTLGHALAGWIRDCATIGDLAPTGVFTLPGSPRLLGYIAQRFKVYGGVAASHYAAMFPRLERAVQEDVLKVVSQIDPALGVAAIAPLRFGEIKEFGALASASQQEGVPMWRVSAGTPDQHDAARVAFKDLALAMLNRIGRVASND